MAFSKRVAHALICFGVVCGLAHAQSTAKPSRSMPALSEPQRAAARADGKLGTLKESTTSALSAIYQFVLQNGLQVVVVPDHNTPLVTEMLWYRVGGVDDPPGYSGLAYFLEKMMFRGTKALRGNGFARTIARNGGIAGGFATHDYTAFYEQVPPGRLKLVMGLEADRMSDLELRDASIRRERRLVLQVRRNDVDHDAQALLEEQMDAALYLSHPYGIPVIGWSAEIRHIDRPTLAAFYAHHYAPNNAILVVAGDVTADTVRTDAEASFGKLAARELRPRAEYAEPPRLGPTRLLIRSRYARHPVFAREYRVVSYPDARPGQAEALAILAQILGGDDGGALYRDLVTRWRLAEDAAASYDGMHRDAGSFSIYAVPRPGVSLSRLERAVDAEIARLRRAPVSPRTLARAKSAIVAEAAARRASQFAQANAYGQALAIGLTVQDVRNWSARIQAVPAREVERAAAAELKPAQSVTGYLLPARTGPEPGGRSAP
ncbi:MAG: insulinase family protein [Alphaproteobacteria bacterium]|nr:insulinase family protein [Alphaproteobacteria bacterium]